MRRSSSCGGSGLTKKPPDRRPSTGQMTKNRVRSYYAAYGEREWNRLDRPEGVSEWLVTCDALTKHLPRCGRILDLGGGTGRHTIWLAQQGYRVVLADLSGELLTIARERIAEAGVGERVEGIRICDASDLAVFADESFDAVLCLGPFYHLTEPADREHAAAELVRVLKPGAPAFVAFMTVYSYLRRTLAFADERRHLANPEFVARLLDDGVFFNDVPGRFDAGNGVYPNEVTPFLQSHGLVTEELLGDTGFAAPHAQHLAEMALAEPAAYRAAMSVIVDTARDPSLLGAGIHLLYVGRKGAGRVAG
ncbi:MAG: class I SAM-dependent methyltransferase [Methylococcaceae bacterium]|nr:class I SAM-dependent methyltransferase [Methylococcaceae bacterium]